MASRDASPERVRRSYADDPTLEPAVFELLEVVFPGIGTTAARAAALGARWTDVSHPYVCLEGGRVVAHVGLIELTLVLEGVERRVGSVHAVATHPEYRRRGLFRRLMEALLADVARRLETLLLTTENPEYYTPFGFRVVVEHEFRVARAADPPASVPSSAAGLGASAPPADRSCDPRKSARFRPLDLDTPEDLATLHRLLATREAVSQVCGVLREHVAFCFNEARGPLWYAEDLDAVCVVAEAPGRLDLYDIVAPRMPTLAEIVMRVPGDAVPREVVVHFAPDRVVPDPFTTDRSATDPVASERPTPQRLTRERLALGRVVPVERVFEHGGPSFLMVRGPFLPPGRAFSLPRPART